MKVLLEDRRGRRLAGILLAVAVVSMPFVPDPATATPDCTEDPEPARWVSAGVSDVGAADPLISAHRGAPHLAPENTLWAYEYAFAYGADTVEVDVRQTSDGRFVAFHDAKVDGKTDGTGSVADMTFDELRALNAADYAPWKGGIYDPARIASVEEVLALAQHVGGGIEFDIKAADDPSRLVDLAERFGVLEESFFNTVDPRIVAGRPDARLIYNKNVEPPGVLFAAGERYRIFGSKLEEFTAENIAEIHDACGVAMPHAYDKGAENEASQIIEARSRGADGAQVNQPDVAAAALGQPVRAELSVGANQAICLLNADNGMGIPGKRVIATRVGIPEPQVLETAKGGCVAAPQDVSALRFDGDASVQPATWDGGIGTTHPRGVHLSFASDPRTTSTVVWFTDSLDDPGSIVEYGPADLACDEEDLTQRSVGDARPAPGADVMTHEVTMDGLAPGAAYCYRVGSRSGWSPIRAGKTAPQSGPFSFVAFGDHGTGPASQSTSAQALALAPDLVLLPGDVSYANGDQPVWDRYFDEVEPLASQIPLMVSLGNHEVEDNFGTAAFRNRFAFPGEELFYSFDYANVHFVHIEAGAAIEEDPTILEREMRWLESDLAQAAVRRATGDIDFVVVTQHFPLYSNHASRGPCDTALVALEEQFFQRYDIDVLLNAHNHHYERSKPMVYGHPTSDDPSEYENPEGLIEVITGGGGKSLYDFTDPANFQSWSASYAKRYHLTRFSVEDDVMVVEAISTDDPRGEVLDRWTLRAGRASTTPSFVVEPNVCLGATTGNIGGALADKSLHRSSRTWVASSRSSSVNRAATHS